MVQLDPVQVELIARDAASSALKQFNENLRATQKEGGKTTDAVAGLSKNFKAFAGAIGLTLAAREVIQFLDEATKSAIELDTAMSSLQLQTGKLGTALLDNLRAASRGTVSDLDLLRAANRALTFEISEGDLVPLMEVAIARARQMGISVTQAFNDIVTGIARGSPMILDNLGIKGISGAFDMYAAKVGKSTDALSDLERQQALINFVLENSQKIVEKQSMVQNSAADQYERTRAEVENLKTEIGSGLLPVYRELLTLTANVVKGAQNLGQWQSDIALFADIGREKLERLKAVGEEPLFANLQELGKGEISTLFDEFAKSGETFEEWSQKVHISDLEIQGLTRSYGDMIDQINSEIEAKGISEIAVQATIAAEKMKTLTDLFKELTQSDSQEDSRLKLLETVLEQADRAGQSRIGVNQGLADTLGFGSVEELQGFLNQNEINLSQGKGGDLLIEGALQRIEIAKEDLDLEQQRLDLTEQIGSEAAVQLELFRRARGESAGLVTSQKDLLTAAQDYTTFASINFPQLIEKMKSEREEAEKIATARERAADAAERELAAQQALDALGDR